MILEEQVKPADFHTSQMRSNLAIPEEAGYPKVSGVLSPLEKPRKTLDSYSRQPSDFLM